MPTLAIPTVGSPAAQQFCNAISGTDSIPFEQSYAWLRGLEAIQSIEGLADQLQLSNILASTSTTWAMQAPF